MTFLPAVCPPGSILHYLVVSLFALYLPLFFCTCTFPLRVCTQPVSLFLSTSILLLSNSQYTSKFVFINSN
ncbi:hypothetical protein F5H01DRAFT_355894 [Linnemannia elongata]|nr:hypothetical protein F5H01DRAFT_355894 [Linnemannia elongata]